MRLLLSINREHAPEEAFETVALAATLRDRGVVGVALTGNPSAGEVRAVLGWAGPGGSCVLS